MSALLVAALPAACSCNVRGTISADAGVQADAKRLQAGDAALLDAVTVDQPSCLATRTLEPRPVARREETGCGGGCQRVSFGADVDVSYDLAGDLLVYSATPVNGKVILIDLAKNTESVIRDSVTGEGCQFVDTDGTQLAYGCFEHTNASQPIVVRLYSYDPGTQIETSHYWYPMTGGAASPVYVTLGTHGLAFAGLLAGTSSIDVRYVPFGSGAASMVSPQKGSDYCDMDGDNLVFGQQLEHRSG